MANLFHVIMAALNALGITLIVGVLVSDYCDIGFCGTESVNRWSYVKYICIFIAAINLIHLLTTLRINSLLVQSAKLLDVVFLLMFFIFLRHGFS